MDELEPIPLKRKQKETGKDGLEAYFVKEVSKLGGKAYKWNSPNNRGVPDRIVFLPGGMVRIVELKRADGRVSATQHRFAKTMRGLEFKQHDRLFGKKAIDMWLEWAKEHLYNKRPCFEFRPK